MLAAVLPSLGVLGLFVLVVRAMVHADRRERAAAARLEAGRATSTAGAEPPGEPDGDSPE